MMELEGQVIKNQTSQVKKNIEKVGGPKSRAVPAFVKFQVEKMMELEEYQEGLDMSEFFKAYHDLHDYHLEFESYGYTSPEDLLHHGLDSSVRLKVNHQGGWNILPKIPNTDI